VRQLVVLSGKGGTGKTTIVAAVARLASRSASVVLADCDVDAANLALLFPGPDDRRAPFFAGRRAVVDGEECIACMQCAQVCHFGAILFDTTARVNPIACEGCGACALVCPVEAMSFEENRAGWWMQRSGADVPLVHARLGVAQDNSGKLVAQVRHQARDLAADGGADLLIVDGPPGIGCPVHASLTGCDLALIVTEPTPAGEHDLIRALDLADHFQLPAAVLVNKHDLSPDTTRQIERRAVARHVPVVGRLPFDRRIPLALARAEVPLDVDTFARPLQAAWEQLRQRLNLPPEEIHG